MRHAVLGKPELQRDGSGCLNRPSSACVRTSAAELSKASPRWSVEVVAYLVMHRSDETPALQSGQCFHLLSRPCTGISKLDLSVGHRLAAKPKGHVPAAVGGAWKRHGQITPQQALQFSESLECGPGDQAAVFGFEVGSIPGHHQCNPPAFVGVAGTDHTQH